MDTASPIGHTIRADTLMSMAFLTLPQLEQGLDCPLKMRYAREGMPTREDTFGRVAQLWERVLRQHYWSCFPADFTGPQQGTGAIAQGVDEAASEIIRAAVATAVRSRRTQRVRDLGFELSGVLVTVGVLEVGPDQWTVGDIFARSMEESADEGTCLRVRDGQVRAEWQPYATRLAVEVAAVRGWLLRAGKSVGVDADIPLHAMAHFVRKSGASGRALADCRARYESSGDLRIELPPSTPEIGRATLIAVPMDRVVAIAGAGLESRIDRLRQMADAERWPLVRECIGARCKRCEFRIEGDEASGFARCWGSRTDSQNDHVLALERLSDRQLHAAVDAAGMGASVSDVPEELLMERQVDSRTALRQGTTITSTSCDALAFEQAPFVFLSLSASMSPLAAWPGARPYELVPFSFSAHLIPDASAGLDGRVALPGFLHIGDQDPRLEFLDALRAQVGEAGTVFIWHPYCRFVLTRLRAWIARDCDQFESGTGMARFLDGMLGTDERRGRMVDLFQYARGARLAGQRFSPRLRDIVRYAWSFKRISSACAPGHLARSDPASFGHPADPWRNLPDVPSGFKSIGGDSDDSEWLYTQARLLGRGGDPEVQQALRARAHLNSLSVLVAHQFLTKVLPEINNHGDLRDRPRDDRAVRIFVSSTFRDFREERDLLKKRVEPELGRRAAERAVSVSVVDLRWGITEEQARSGQTLPVCMREVERCRPYFIGLLGQRYGWVPSREAFSRVAIDTMPWVREHLGGASVTELEIRHGAINAAVGIGSARFYFRDPAYASGRGPEFEAASPQDATRLEALKQAIRDRGFPVLENYRDPAAFAHAVTEDLWSRIDRDFPRDLVGDASLPDMAAQLSHRRRCRKQYDEDHEEISALQGAIADPTVSRVIVEGGHASGKTTLLARSVDGLTGSAHLVVVDHYVGIGRSAPAPEPVAHRIMAVASSRLGLAIDEIPFGKHDQPNTRMSAIGELARQLGKRLVVAIDGVDAMVPTPGSRWLEDIAPRGVTLVLTAVPGGAVASAHAAAPHAVTIPVRPFTEKRTIMAVRRMMEAEGRELPKAALESIVAHPASRHPGFLRVLINELLVCPTHEELPVRLQECLAAQDLRGLYRTLLTRLENEFGRTFVGDVLAAIASAPEGITEPELIRSLGANHVSWYGLQLQLHTAVSDAGGTIRIPPGAFAEAVRARYP